MLNLVIFLEQSIIYSALRYPISELFQLYVSIHLSINSFSLFDLAAISVRVNLTG